MNASGPRLRASPEDFCVEEVPLYPPAGAGEHTFVHVEKRLRTTEEVARALARAAGVGAREVGYAGRKDRVAVARQWLSVPGLSPEQAVALEIEGVRVLEATPHRHKLRTGQLRANRFDIVVRGLDAATIAAAHERAAGIERRGMPNRYGAQRYGRDGANVERAAALLRGEARAAPRERRFLVSALQSAVFDRVLEERLAQGIPLDAVEAGDVAVVHASGGLFDVEDVARELPRAQRFEISATGPIPGTRERLPRGAPAERERAAAQALGWPARETLRPPRGLRLRGARRPLRARPQALELEAQGDGALRLRFTLPAGAYATVLVEALFGPFSEGPDPAVS